MRESRSYPKILNVGMYLRQVGQEHINAMIQETWIAKGAQKHIALTEIQIHTKSVFVFKSKAHSHQIQSNR